MSTSGDPGRPSVEQVALFIRARTKDDQGREVGTFDDATRPTGDQVEAHIDAARSLVALRLPAFDKLPADLLAGVATTTALEAACQIEKAFWPEQLVSGKSPYEQLRVEADAAVAALAEQASAALGGSEYEFGDIASLPIRSWTSQPLVGFGVWPLP